MNRRGGAEGGRLATVTVAVTRGVLVAVGPVVLRAAFAKDVPDPGPPSGGGVDLGPLLGGLSGLRDAIARRSGMGSGRSSTRCGPGLVFPLVLVW